MKLRKTMKKIVALGTGVSMLGATLFGATAADLSNYPEPFVKDGKFTGSIVVGDSAAAQDVIGAVDIAVSLQQAATTEKTVVLEEEGETTVQDGELEDELVVGDETPLGADKEYDEDELSVLNDDEVSYADSDYDYKEIVKIDDGALTAVTGEEAEEWGTDVHVLVDADKTLAYRFDFEDPVEFDAGEDDPLEVSILGRELDVEDWNDEDDEVTIAATQEAWLHHGESLDVTLDGSDYTIEVLSVYDGEAMLSVNGVQELLSTGDESDFDYEDFELELMKSANDDGTENDLVKIRYGTATSEQASHGSAAEMFGEPDDDTEAEWVWDIDSNQTHLFHIGVQYNQYRTEVESELSEDWELPALMAGDAISFPDNFAQVQFANVRNHQKRADITAQAEDSTNWYDDDGNKVFTSGDNVVEFEAPSDIFIYDGENYEKVIFARNLSKVGLEQGDTDESDLSPTVNAQGFIEMEVEGDNHNQPVWFNGTSVYIPGGNETAALAEVTPTTKDLTWNIDWVDDDAEETDLVYGTSNVGTRDYDFMLNSGLIVYDPEAGNDEEYAELKLSAPADPIEWELAVTAEEAAVTGGSKVTTTEINPIAVGAAKLASEVSVGSQNMIVVGGPCVNPVAATLMGNPEPCHQDFEEGKAIVKLYENGGKVSMLVAGATALDTRRASRVVANYEEYSDDMTGDEVSVEGTSTTFSDTVVSAPTAE